MKPARILIVEDKAIIAEHLAATLEHAGYTVTGKISSGEEAIRQVESEAPDLILMDIHLAGKLDGIQTTEQINRRHAVPVIYLTDFHDKSTIDRAKSTRPAAYLLKPFKEQDLLVAIEIAFHNASSGKEAVPGADGHARVTETLFPLRDRFFIKDNDILVRVDIDDMLWVKADRSYFEIKTSRKVFKLVGNLNQFNKKFSHPMLMRVHRSYIVNVDKITGIRGNMLLVGEGINAEIPTSESYREEVHRRLQML